MKKSAKILIVEDDDFLRSLAFTKLTSSGYSVEVATDGQAGYDKIAGGGYDLVILDLLLPVLSGFEVLKKMQENDLIKKQEIIVFSNLGTKSDIKQVVDCGVQNYMIKSSFTLDELVTKIQELLK